MHLRRPQWLILVLAASVAAAFAGLGAWQLGRAQWKELYLASFQAAMATPPVDLAGILREHDHLPARVDLPQTGRVSEASLLALPIRARARGRFIEVGRILLDNQLRDGQAGVLAYALFQPERADRLALVNLGWLRMPADRALPGLPDLPQGMLEISGVLAALPAVGIKLEQPRFERRREPQLMLYLDIGALRRGARSDIFDGALLLDGVYPFGFARDWRPLPNTLTPAKHRGYAVQWFALSLAAAVIGTIFGLIRKKTA